jgi:hypothetical protein
VVYWGQIKYSLPKREIKRHPPFLAMFEFSEFIFEQGLMDIPLVGGNFTGSNNFFDK